MSDPVSNTRRQELVDAVGLELEKISTGNNYSTDFDRVTYWQDTPTEYRQNHLNFQDEEEKYQPENTQYDAALEIYLRAIVIETATSRASKLGNLALNDLIKAVSDLCLEGALIHLVDSRKWCETKGKTACLIELQIKVLYHFER